MTENKRLERAYTMKTPEDSVALYGDWATDYDDSFAQTHGYVAPRKIAATFRELAGDRETPVLDIGAGTGLVGEELRGLAIDAIDISAEMLAKAEAKGVYRRHVCADLTAPLDIADASYGGFASAGTFTHGHVGPACLPELMRIARPGALFVLGIRSDAFDGAGFGSAFAALVADGAIGPVDFQHLGVYENAEHAHAGDTYLTAIFRRR